MKNKLYYIFIITIIIFNISLLYKNAILNRELDNIMQSMNTSDIDDEQTHFLNPYNLSNSKYIQDLENIDIQDDKMRIKFRLSDDIKSIVEDSERILDKKSSNVIIDDEYVIIEFDN